MSIYSGFATRQQQTLYNSSIYSLVQLLAIRILKNGPEHQSMFLSKLVKLQKTIERQQRQKYLQPKYTPLVIKLLQSLQKNGGIQGSNISQPSLQPPQPTISLHQDKSISDIQKSIGIFKGVQHKIINVQQLRNKLQVLPLIQQKSKSKSNKKSKSKSKHKKHKLRQFIGNYEDSINVQNQLKNDIIQTNYLLTSHSNNKNNFRKNAFIK